ETRRHKAGGYEVTEHLGGELGVPATSVRRCREAEPVAAGFMPACFGFDYRGRRKMSWPLRVAGSRVPSGVMPNSWDRTSNLPKSFPDETSIFTTLNSLSSDTPFGCVAANSSPFWLKVTV